MEENHKESIKKIKVQLAAQEKEKREQLFQEKSKEIKEQTIKSIEPEIQKIIAVNRVFIQFLSFRNTRRTFYN
jgi:5-azacytidine-induced protein 1